MSYFLDQPALFDQPLRLGKKEREDPFGVMADFFNDYRLHECRHQLWQMAECCLTTETGSFDEAEERAVMLQYYKDLEGLLEAAWLIVRQEGPPGSSQQLKRHRCQQGPD